MKVEDIEIRKSLGGWKPKVYLTNVCISHYEEPTYAHKKIFPVCPVDFPSGYYYTFSKADLARDNVKVKPAYGKVAPAQMGLTEDSYSCQVYQINIGFDKLIALSYQRAKSPGSADPMKARAKMIAEQIAQHQEFEFAKKFFSAEAWEAKGGTVWTGAASGNDATKTFKKFDDTNDPVDFFDRRSIDIRRNGRRKPNKIALGIETFAALKNNKWIKERIKYSGTTQNPAIVTESVLAQIFGVDQVVVLDSTYNEAGVNEEENMQYICDPKGALLLYAPDAPQVDTPSAGYIFTWNLVGSNYIAIDTYEGEAGTHTEIMEGIIAYDMKITAPSLAIFFKDCVK